MHMHANPSKTDTSGSHILSQKAVDEQWDTFIFFTGRTLRGQLLVGFKTHELGLKRSDIGRWLKILNRAEPSETPPILYPCKLRQVGAVAYIPELDSPPPPPLDWEKSTEDWEPGNYALTRRFYGDPYWTCGYTPRPISQILHVTHQASLHDAMIIPSDIITPPSFILTTGRATEEMCQIHIKPLTRHCEDSSDPDNRIILPVMLKQDFYDNNFGYDWEVKRFVVFPSASEATKDYLNKWQLKATPGADPYFLTEHFLRCLQVHCLSGDLSQQYDASDVYDRKLQWKEKGPPESDEDNLDTAMRAWYELLGPDEWEEDEEY
ncbi:hypothetical protein PQX77_011866 [Marasmius sp. AFHP31]|nr:hypothetical protein PQX77_011866 [Marasmius sp. AFHP31]